MTVHNDGQFRVNAATLNAGHGVIQKPAINHIPNASVFRVENGTETGFAKILDQVTRRDNGSGLKLSKHAETRLTDRNINLSAAQREKIANALIRADQKGVKDALVMIDGLAIVANAKTMTVITAVGNNDLQENIFTNIDGAVFA